MRQRLPSVLRSWNPLHLEPFETRWLLSGAGLLAPLLSSPPPLSSTTLAAPQLLAATLPAVNATNTLTQTAANLLNGLGKVSTPSRNTVVVPQQVADTGLSTISAATASLLTSVNNLATAIAGPLSGLVGATTNAILAFVSPSSPLNPVGIVSSLAASVPVSADIGLSVNGSSINVDLGQNTGPLVTVKLDASVAGPSSASLVVQAQGSQSGGEGIQVTGSTGGYLGSERFAVEIVGGLSPSGPILQGNAAAAMSSETNFHGGSPIEDLHSDGEEVSGVGSSGFEANVSRPIEAAVTFPEGGPEMGISLEGDSEPAGTLDLSSPLAFPPLPADSFLAALTGGGEGAEAALELDHSTAPVLARQVMIESGASVTEEDGPVFPPSSQGVLADLLPLDLTSLEGDIQTFLEQVEQLGAELSSMLGRMNLSPLLMAIAIAALAGEIARRQWHRPQPRPLLASFAGAAAECGLPDPWSAENV